MLNAVMRHRRCRHGLAWARLGPDCCEMALAAPRRSGEHQNPVRPIRPRLDQTVGGLVGIAHKEILAPVAGIEGQIEGELAGRGVVGHVPQGSGVGCDRSSATRAMARDPLERCRNHLGWRWHDGGRERPHLRAGGRRYRRRQMRWWRRSSLWFVDPATGADAEIGGFGGLFDLKAAGFQGSDPRRRQ